MIQAVLSLIIRLQNMKKLIVGGIIMYASLLVV